MIIGLGSTGLSYARYLASRGEPFTVLDDKPDAARVEALRAIDPAASIEAVSAEAVMAATDVYLSPGVPLRHPAVQQAVARNTPVHGDVQMFGQLARAPIAAVTGTNGKSTVVELLTVLAKGQMEKVQLAGNIGTPCLDVLSDDVCLYVLEASSYQLELADQLPAKVACLLNLSPDHLDRYDSLEDYYETKLAIYNQAEQLVINRELKDRVAVNGRPFATFGTDCKAGEANFGLQQRGGSIVLMQGLRELIDAGELQITGQHNLANALAALAMGWLLGLDVDQMLEDLVGFKGLPHRSALVAEINGVRFVNDSKATNPGAMLSSVNGYPGVDVHLIAGGLTKGLRLEPVAEAIRGKVCDVYLIGLDQSELEAAFHGHNTHRTLSIEDAASQAARNASPGDVVLLAPGCASQDQFVDYRDRGDQFAAAVRRLA